MHMLLVAATVSAGLLILDGGIDVVCGGASPGGSLLDIVATTASSCYLLSCLCCLLFILIRQVATSKLVVLSAAGDSSSAAASAAAAVAVTTTTTTTTATNTNTTDTNITVIEDDTDVTTNRITTGNHSSLTTTSFSQDNIINANPSLLSYYRLMFSAIIAKIIPSFASSTIPNRTIVFPTLPSKCSGKELMLLRCWNNFERLPLVFQKSTSGDLRIMPPSSSVEFAPSVDVYSTAYIPNSENTRIRVRRQSLLDNRILGEDSEFNKINSNNNNNSNHRHHRHYRNDVDNRTYSVASLIDDYSNSTQTNDSSSEIVSFRENDILVIVPTTTTTTTTTAVRGNHGNSMLNKSSGSTSHDPSLTVTSTNDNSTNVTLLAVIFIGLLTTVSLIVCVLSHCHHQYHNYRHRNSTDSIIGAPLTDSANSTQIDTSTSSAPSHPHLLYSPPPGWNYQYYQKLPNNSNLNNATSDIYHNCRSVNDRIHSPATVPMLALEASLERERCELRERQIRLHSANMDIALNLPPRIELPDGEEIPYGSSTRLHIRDPEQESEIYRNCVRGPPNRTIHESECEILPYRSNSAGFLSMNNSVNDWVHNVFRCHSMSNSRHHVATPYLPPILLPVTSRSQRHISSGLSKITMVPCLTHQSNTSKTNNKKNASSISSCSSSSDMSSETTTTTLNSKYLETTSTTSTDTITATIAVTTNTNTTTSSNSSSITSATIVSS